MLDRISGFFKKADVKGRVVDAYFLSGKGLVNPGLGFDEDTNDKGLVVSLDDFEYFISPSTGSPVSLSYKKDAFEKHFLPSLLVEANNDNSLVVLPEKGFYLRNLGSEQNYNNLLLSLNQLVSQFYLLTDKSLFVGLNVVPIDKELVAPSLHQRFEKNYFVKEVVFSYLK